MWCYYKNFALSVHLNELITQEREENATRGQCHEDLLCLCHRASKSNFSQ